MHPSELGFTLELAFSVAPDGVLTRELLTDQARQSRSLLYVAWLSPAERALKVGLSEKSLWIRWANVVRNMERPLEKLPFLRPNEVRDREKLLLYSRGQRVEVWITPYPPVPTTPVARFTTGMSLKSAEAFLDRRYAPLFGRPLGEREPWEPNGRPTPSRLQNRAGDRTEIQYTLPDFREHPKLTRSSSRVQQSCESICTLLMEKGFDFGLAGHRDGFSLVAVDGRAIRIDPKLEWLRIKVGKDLPVSPPAVLVHNGHQPDWLIVEPPDLSIALAYLGTLAEHWAGAKSMDSG